eukprot:365393-Chlamydomonas_euryale.AAC.1
MASNPMWNPMWIRARARAGHSPCSVRTALLVAAAVERAQQRRVAAHRLKDMVATGARNAVSAPGGGPAYGTAAPQGRAHARTGGCRHPPAPVLPPDLPHGVHGVLEVHAWRAGTRMHWCVSAGACVAADATAACGCIGQRCGFSVHGSRAAGRPCGGGSCGQGRHSGQGRVLPASRSGRPRPPAARAAASTRRSWQIARLPCGVTRQAADGGGGDGGGGAPSAGARLARLPRRRSRGYYALARCLQELERRRARGALRGAGRRARRVRRRCRLHGCMHVADDHQHRHKRRRNRETARCHTAAEVAGAGARGRGARDSAPYRTVAEAGIEEFVAWALHPGGCGCKDARREGGGDREEGQRCVVASSRNENFHLAPHPSSRTCVSYELNSTEDSRRRGGN